MPLVSNPQSSPIKRPKWRAFQVQMFGNAAYLRVSEGCANPLLVSRLENFFAIQGEALEIATQLWGGMLLLCPLEQLPTAIEANEWEQIASTNAMPVMFDSAGAMWIRGA